jgi:hypothetical protein
LSSGTPIQAHAATPRQVVTATSYVADVAHGPGKSAICVSTRSLALPAADILLLTDDLHHLGAVVGVSQEGQSLPSGSAL